MDQIGVRRPNNLPASLTHAETKIDIVKVIRQILVKAAELTENRFSQCHACRGNCGAILRQDERPILPRDRFWWKTLERMARHSVQSKDYASMLQSPVRIPQPRPNRAHLWPHSVTD